VADQDVRARLIIDKVGDQQAFTEAAEGVRGLGEASDQLSGGEAALNNFLDALEQLGSEGKSGADAAKEGVSQLGDTLGQLADGEIPAFQESVDKVAESLPSWVDQARKAEDAVRQLGQSTEGSFEGAETKATRARAALNEYKEALDAAKAAGQNVTADQQAKLEQLEAEYRTATKAIGEFKTAQQEAKRDIAATTAEAGGQVRGFSSLEGALEKVGGKFGSVGLQVLAAGAAFKVGWEAGTKLRDVLNEITNGGFDRGIQNIFFRSEEFAAMMRKTGDDAVYLRNQMNILRGQGIDPTGLSAEEMSAKIAELGRQTHASADEAKAAGEKYKEWAEGLKLSKEKLGELSGELRTNIETFANANTTLSQIDLKRIFAGQIQDVLDAYARLGVEVPVAIQQIAAQWAVTTTAAETAAEKQKAVVDKMRASILGVVTDIAKQAEEVLSGLDKALEGIDVAALNPEQLSNAKIQAQAWLDVLRAGGKDIPPLFAEFASKLGLAVGQYEIAATTTDRVTASNEALKRSTEVLVTVTDAAGKSHRITAAQAHDLAVATGTLGDAEGRTAAAIRLTSAAATAAKGPLDAAATGAGQSAEALNKQATAADAAGTGLGKVATGATDLGTGAGAAKTPVADLGTEVTTLGTAAGTLLTNLAGIGGKIKTEFAGAAGFSSPIIAELGAIDAKVAATLAGLSALANFQGGGGGGGAPVGPPSTFVGPPAPAS
jgi:hypothetical protein